jgi:hypothetical protein
LGVLLGEGSWGFGMIWAMASIHVAGSNERLLLLRSARLKLSARETDWLPLMAVLDGAGLGPPEPRKNDCCSVGEGALSRSIGVPTR